MSTVTSKTGTKQTQPDKDQNQANIAPQVMNQETLNQDTDQSKRKRSEISSTSDLSFMEDSQNVPEGKQKKPKKKKSKNTEMISEFDETNSDLEDIKMQLKDVAKQMKQFCAKIDRMESQMNTKIDKTVKRDDGSLREIMKELLTEMKEDLLKSVMHRIEIIEGKVFEKDQEKDKMKERITILETNIEKEKSDTNDLYQRMKYEENRRWQYENEAEQYSRRNNVKIKGLSDDNKKETARETAEKVISFLKEKNIADLKLSDIDYTHRLPNKTMTNREVIVRFVSRFTRDQVIGNRKLLARSGTFINEDLTKTNLQVLMCVKKKLPGTVKEAWSSNGTIFYKDFTGRKVTVRFKDYEEWLDLPWLN